VQAIARKRKAAKATQVKRVEKRTETERVASTTVQAAMRRRSAKAEADRLAKLKAERLAREAQVLLPPLRPHTSHRRPSVCSCASL